MTHYERQTPLALQQRQVGVDWPRLL